MYDTEITDLSLNMNYPLPTVTIQRVFARAQEYVGRSYPVRDMPINIRPVSA